MSSPALRALPPRMWSYTSCGTRVCVCVSARMCTRVRKTQLCRLVRGARGQVWLPHANYKVLIALGHRSDEEMAAESTRRFTKNLLKPGSAAEIRQTACNAVRHSAVTVSRPVRIVEKRKKNMVVVEKRITTCGALRLWLLCAFKHRDPQKKLLHLEMWKLYPSSVHTATRCSCARPDIGIHVASFFAVVELGAELLFSLYWSCTGGVVVVVGGTIRLNC